MKDTVVVYKHRDTGHWHLKKVHTQDDIDELRGSDLAEEVVVVFEEGKLVASHEDTMRILSEMESAIYGEART
jgi:hypothetical protein